VQPLIIDGPVKVKPGAEISVSTNVNDPEDSSISSRWVLRAESHEYVTGGDFRPTLPDIEGAIVESNLDTARVRMPREPGAYRLFFYAHDQDGNAATANAPLLVEGQVRTRFPVSVYDDNLAGMPWVPSGWMGTIEQLTIDGDHTDNPRSGNASIKLSYTGRSAWVAVAWQNPPNNWGDEDGGYDLTGATALTLWARGEYGGEKIKIGVGLLEEDTEYPDSVVKQVDGITLTSDWQQFRVPLKGEDLSSVKTGFVVTISGRVTPVTVYLDSIRFVR
ncbi:MAG: hypothetical protein KJO35_08430, partial [Gammaproteobacteria bacterium]|nr:hypothetical protein [Gammaproteobacteria bacterium]